MKKYCKHDDNDMYGNSISNNLHKRWMRENKIKYEPSFLYKLKVIKILLY